MRFFVAVLILVGTLWTVPVTATERPMLVRVEVADRAEVRVVGEILDLDEKTRGNVLYGWGTAKDIEAVENLGFLVELVPPEPKNTEALTMCSEPFAPPFPWNCHPTWTQFETMMTHYATTYPAIARLVNQTVLWINPLSNPDGTFAGGDTNVSGASRGLPASGYADPNRSFPDPSVPEDPTNPGWPAEVQRMIDLAKAEHFNVAANCHAGAEVFNYPWDVWSVWSPDDDWWIAAGTDYASSAQSASPGGYFTMCSGSCPYPDEG